jgi:hypothetical protein
MPSSFSPNLRIELIGDGEQYDSWGDTTNTNLGTLIEDAIAGLVTVSVTSANQALTAVDGGADQSRNAILSFTTTTAANFSVYAPPVSKLYVIHNASAYTATIYNSTVEGNTTAAGTGVAVPAGKIMAVWSDGTNFDSQITHIPSSVLGSGTADNTVFLRGDRQWATVPDPIVSGTKMLFQQTAAPTGWTKDTTHDNKALRVVSGTASTGGSVAFTTAFASQAVSGSVGNTTLSAAQMPSHSHGYDRFTNVGYNSGKWTLGGPGVDAWDPVGNSTGGAGSSNAHNHTFTGTAINLAVSYVDIIIATKN